MKLSLPDRVTTTLHLCVQLTAAVWLLWVSNAWAFHHSWRHDLTRERTYALSEETHNYLAQLPAPVEVIVPYSFGPSTAGRLQKRVFSRGLRYLGEIALASSAVTIREIVDIGRDPAHWKDVQERFGIDQHNKIHLFSGEKRSAISLDDLADFRFPSPMEPAGRGSIVRERVPEAILAGLRRVSIGCPETILFSQGSGELSLEEPWGGFSMRQLERDLKDRGYQVGTVDLPTMGEVPEECSLLVVVGGGIGAFSGLGETATWAVDSYLKEGGSLLLLLPGQTSSGLESTLAEHGIVADEGRVAVLGPVPGGATMETTALIARRVSDTHPITRGISARNFKARLRDFRPLIVSEGATTILASDPECWIERDFAIRRDADESQEIVPLVAVSGGEGESRIAVFGSWNVALDRFHGGDLRRLTLGTIDWLATEDSLLAGTGRSMNRDRILLSAPVRRAFFWTSIGVIPFCSLLAGVFTMWWRRRTG